MTKLEVKSDIKPFTIVKNAIIDSVDILNEHEKILYIVLLRYGDKAFPSLSTLSHKCGFSKRTAQRTIDTLIEKGLLRKRSRINKKSGNTSNAYTLIDNDKIWFSTKENLQENIDTAILEEAIKIVEASGRKVFDKEKGLVSDSSQTADTSTMNYNSSTRNDNIKQLKSQELERYTIDQIHQLFDYDVMLQENPYRKNDIDSAMSVLYTAMNTTKATIRVAGEGKPTMIIISKLMKLDKESIMYALDRFAEQTERIKNPTSYLLTILYFAPEQFHLDIQNQVSHDMACWNQEE